MKINILIMTFFLIVFTINPSYAENITSWHNKGILTIYHDSSENKDKVFLSSIDYSQGGQKRLYFYDIGYNTLKEYYRNGGTPEINSDNLYEHFKDLTNQPVIIFNGQAIKMSSRIDNSLGKPHYVYTPQTNQGLNYIVNLFKKEVKPVKVEIGYNSFYVPVNGFTREWNKTSNNSF